MKITYKEIREYRQKTKSNWHDQSWWDLKNSVKGEAIDMAIDEIQRGDTEKDVYDRANENYRMMVEDNVPNYLKLPDFNLSIRG